MALVGGGRYEVKPCNMNDLIEKTFPEVRTVGYRRSGCIEVGDDEITAKPGSLNV